MKYLLTLFAVMLFVSSAFADDPGARDSIIVETVYAELGDSTIDVRIYATCDDSVGYYILPLSWHAIGDSGAGIYPVDITYYYPITQWDYVWDSVLVAEQFIRMVGMTNGGDIDPALITYNARLHCWTLHFAVDSLATPQIVEIDSTLDPVNGSLLFGLFGGTISFPPDFTPGAIFYGVSSDIFDNNINLPRKPYLLQNHPNPFNASTTIEFMLPEEADVELSVYNILGQRVAILVDGRMEAGKHSFIWDGAVAPSGVYFVKLNTGSKSETIKALLLK